MKNRWYYMVILFSLISQVSCVDEVPELSSSNKILADSLLRVENRRIYDEVDSLCKLNYQTHFDNAVDSISAVRLQEIEKYIPNQ